MDRVKQGRMHKRLPWLILVATGLAVILDGLSLLVIQKRVVVNAGEGLALAASDIAGKLDWFLFERYGDVQELAQAQRLGGLDALSGPGTGGDVSRRATRASRERGR